MKQRMKNCVGLLVCVLVVCMCLTAFAQEVRFVGCAYVDDNANAVCDQGEALIAGVPVMLQSMQNGAWETVGEMTTDAYGQYAFEGLAEGEYRLKCRLNDVTYYAASIGASAQYAEGAAVWQGESGHTDIGLRPAALLMVNAYSDSNADGQRGQYERVLSGVQVEVLSGDAVMADGMTDKKGSVTLTTAPGEHTVRLTLAQDYAFAPIGRDNQFESAEASAQMQVTLVPAQTVELWAGARPVGSLSGKAFEDMNNNGIMDESDPGVEGMTIRIEGSRTGTLRQIVTDASGEYCFDRLPDDLYTISAELPDGMLYARYSKTGGDKRSIFTGSNVVREFVVKQAAHVKDKNIGTVQKGVISGTAFFDLNYNGLWDEEETGYPGVTVEAIKLSNNESLGKAVTGDDGTFRIENLRGGDYRLRAILPEDGAIFSVTAEGTPDQVNRFAQRSSRRENSVQPLTIESGSEASALIGVARGATVRGTVFEDADYNGRLNGKEKNLTGLKVRAVDANGNVVATDTTGKKGQYLLSGLMPGTYTIEVQRKADFGFTRLRPEEKNGSFIAALENGWGKTQPMEIAMAQEITGVNAGMLPSATVKGSFFHDANDNGLWDKQELGMMDAKVRLVSDDGEFHLEQSPQMDGSYFFDGVMPGKYTLTYVLPEHCEMSQVVKGGNTVEHIGLETSLEPFKVTMGKAVEMPVAGAVTLGSFEGWVFNDTNANGVKDDGEALLAGATIRLLGEAGTETEAVSAADGSFSVAALRPDAYTLSIQLPDGYIFSHDLTADELALDRVSEQSMACPWTALINRESKFIGAVKPASISGEIWMDENRDGAQADGEWIMEGLKLMLIDEAQPEETALMAETTSDANGFCFDNLRPGSYTVRFELPEQSTPAADVASTFRLNGLVMEQNGIRVSEGETVDGLATGLVSRTSIGGTAWLDENGSRSPVQGVHVALMADGNVLATAVTDENGVYRFDGLWPDAYQITASLPQEMIFARPDDPNYNADASIIADVHTGASRTIDLLMAQHQLQSDVLYIKPAKVGDLAWLDVNRNGLLDSSERRLAGVTIRLVQNGETVYETTTDAYGYYLFDDVYPGQYVLEAVAWPQLSPTRVVESLRIISSCLASGDGEWACSDMFSVLSGETNANFDLGYILLDGQTLPPETLVSAPGRDWTIPNMPREK